MSDIDWLRRSIPDLDSALFDDATLTAYLGDVDNQKEYALANIWEAIAGSHLLLFKANVRADDGTVTASEHAKLYLQRAADMRKRADALYDGWSLVGGENAFPSH